MGKFKENDRVVIKGGENAGIIKQAYSYPKYAVEFDDGIIKIYDESELDFQNVLDEQIGEYVEPMMSEDDYLSEMSTVAFDNGINININQEIDRLSIAYFKVYDHANVNAAKRVVRLHFKDSGIEYHRDPLGKQPWKLSSRDIKKIANLLKQPNHEHDNMYTNWQVLCYRWNRDNQLIPSNATTKEYLSGKYDNQKFNDTRLENAYVPSTQEMPETWKYESK